jgi:hypothetical protein
VMLFVVLSLLPLLQATGPPAREPAGLASGWAAIPRSMWLSNYSHAYRAEKTIVAAGLTEDTIVAYNSAQPWSPAHGVVNGSFVRMTFGSLELRGKLLPTGYIIWENGSRWLKERSADSNTTARSVKPSGSAPKPRAATGADESYSYSCAACPVHTVLVRAKRPRTPTRAFICAADDDEASYTYDETTSTGGDETYSYDSYESYESCAPLQLELFAP